MPQDFYDGLAPEYHALFEDWWASAQCHGRVIADVLAARGVVARSTVLDCACGIGTQALPLAAAGYRVTGTDISPGAVARARAEAQLRNIGIELKVADLRRVRDAVEGFHDVVISCDNALSHLLTDADLTLALRSIRACLGDGGVFLASQRDYDSLAAARPVGTPVELYGRPGQRHGTAQSWGWSADGDSVDITLFVLRETLGQDWQVSAHEARYRVLRRARLTAALAANGFGSIQWLPPQQSGFYQPVVTAIAR
jgi:glycine/sarcosine N-methyltransferase